jgi:hypothetical protein
MGPTWEYDLPVEEQDVAKAIAYVLLGQGDDLLNLDDD